MNLALGFIRGAMLLHTREWRQLENSILSGIFFSLAIIIPGMFLGAISFTLKLIVLDAGIAFAAFWLIYLLTRRFMIGTELVTLYHLSKQPENQRDTLGALGKGLATYVEVAATAITTVMALGFIAIFIPAHRNPAFAVLLLLGGFAAFTASVSFGRNLGVWRRIVGVTIAAVIVVSLLALLMPDPAEIASFSQISPYTKLDESEIRTKIDWVGKHQNVLTIIGLCFIGLVGFGMARQKGSRKADADMPSAGLVGFAYALLPVGVVLAWLNGWVAIRGETVFWIVVGSFALVGGLRLALGAKGGGRFIGGLVLGLIIFVPIAAALQWYDAAVRSPRWPFVITGRL